MNIEMTWLSTVRDIVESDTGDLRELARIAGGEPESFYASTSLDGADIRGQDLSGMRFGPTEMEKVLVDLNTKIDVDSGAGITLKKLAEGQLRSIMQAKRQEERLVLAVKFILKNPQYIDVLFENYVEDKKFALRAINNLRAMDVSFYSGKNLELALCKFLDRELNNSFPLARGFFLRFVAVHLADRLNFRNFVKKRLVLNFTMKDHYEFIRMTVDKYERNCPKA